MIEFLEDTHQYLVDGILVKSVTQILKLIFPNKYSNVSENVLSEKAKFGTLGHKIIETLDIEDIEKAKMEVLKLYETKEISQDLFICLREYLRLAKDNEIKIIEQEKKVSYKRLYAGTLDMKAYVKGKKSLIDIKFTAELDKDYLEWQLGMYNLAENDEFEEHYCLWLPKGKLAKLEKITPKSEKEILKILEVYCENK